jgi:hypothetical protein
LGAIDTDPEAEGEEDDKPEPLTDDLVEQRVRRAAEAVALAVKEGS